MNWYKYTANNPATYTDPSGLKLTGKNSGGAASGYGDRATIQYVVGEVTGLNASNQRYDIMAANPTAYNTADFWTYGIYGAAYRIATTDEPFSAQNWADSFTVATAFLGVFGFIRTAVSSSFARVVCTEGIVGVDAVDSAITQASKTEQLHHFLSNKNSTYTPLFENITNKYNLNLDADWNKAMLPHQGRHTNMYHDYMLEELKQIDRIANGDSIIFLREFEQLKQIIIDNPDMLYMD